MPVSLPTTFLGQPLAPFLEHQQDEQSQINLRPMPLSHGLEKNPRPKRTDRPSAFRRSGSFLQQANYLLVKKNQSNQKWKSDVILAKIVISMNHLPRKYE